MDDPTTEYRRLFSVGLTLKTGYGEEFYAENVVSLLQGISGLRFEISTNPLDYLGFVRADGEKYRLVHQGSALVLYDREGHPLDSIEKHLGVVAEIRKAVDGQLQWQKRDYEERYADSLEHTMES